MYIFYCKWSFDICLVLGEGVERFKGSCLMVYGGVIVVFLFVDFVRDVWDLRFVFLFLFYYYINGFKGYDFYIDR